MNDNPLCAQAAFLAAPPRFSYPVFYLTGSCCLLPAAFWLAWVIAKNDAFLFVRKGSPALGLCLIVMHFHP
ncbi:hypothetical protein EAW52_05635 [Pseudomonas sp. LTJR-52]|uniref:hypothetical protein n=1 Tax=Pseudomonas sp. LTJR-52 TaxID=2479392 RepID=UPI000EFD6A6A|nr:hypothetical protein [Pseudomonas sp. LTJR-52]AYN93488.1 hypothetical protein EAW52_05635 [Pseudomonas sp. LTJR-52]